MLGASELCQTRETRDPWSDRWKGPALGIRVTSKGKVDSRLLDGMAYKGWHSDRIKPFILRQDK